MEMSPKQRLDHMAKMYDAYGYGGAAKKKKSKKSKSKSEKKPVKKAGVSVGGAKRPLSAYNLFFRKYRLKGLSAKEIGAKWQSSK